jgi:hypothetical protein
MFRGAEVIFRRVLVPLSGQYEPCAYVRVHGKTGSRKKSIPEVHRVRVLAKAAEVSLPS